MPPVRSRVDIPPKAKGGSPQGRYRLSCLHFHLVVVFVVAAAVVVVVVAAAAVVGVVGVVVFTLPLRPVVVWTSRPRPKRRESPR